MAEPPERNPLPTAATAALLTSARHELRSPLQVIQGFAELLSAESYGTLSSDQRMFVDHIVQGGVALSRIMDACFDLLQAELLPGEIVRSALPCRRVLEDALALARDGHGVLIDPRLAQLPMELLVEVDGYALTKATGAIVCALGPQTQGPLVVSAAPREGFVEVLFGLAPGAARPVFRDLQNLADHAPTARALLWLRLAAALLAGAGGTLEAGAGCGQARVLLPLVAAR